MSFPYVSRVRGRNFAFRDWYQGVSRAWQPYISKVYKRAAEPQLNVIAIAMPIKASDQTVIGILVLQARLDILFEWSRGISVGPGGFTYFVDRQGQLAAHPNFPLQGEIVNFSKISSVKHVLKGEKGVQIDHSPMEQGLHHS